MGTNQEFKKSLFVKIISLIGIGGFILYFINMNNQYINYYIMLLGIFPITVFFTKNKKIYKVALVFLALEYFIFISIIFWFLYMLTTRPIWGV